MVVCIRLSSENRVLKNKNLKISVMRESSTRLSDMLEVAWLLTEMDL